MVKTRDVDGTQGRRVVCRSRTAKTGQPPVLYMGGYNATADGVYSSAAARVRRLADSGFTVLAADYGGNHWGAAVAVTRAGQGKTLLQASPWLAAAGPVLISANSMGCLGALNFIRDNPANVGGAYLSLPALNLGGLYTENRSGFAASISTAHGGAPPTSSDPYANTDDFEGGPPIRLAFSEDDPLCLASEVAAFADALPGVVTTVSLGSVGHPTPAPVDSADEVAFLRPTPREEGHE